MNKSELVSIRGFLPDDKSFIYASWLRGLYYGESIYSEMPKQLFMENYHKVIDLIFKRPNTQIKVACLKEDSNVILGYSVLCDDAVHWVFCKKNWRGIGLAKDLVPSNVNTVTNLTKVGMSLMKKKGMQFNPFIL